MPPKREREQTVKSALTRLLVDHSPPPRYRKPKRQKVDRRTGSSTHAHSQDTETQSIKKSTTGLGAARVGEKDGDSTTVEASVPEKPPVKNKVWESDCPTVLCEAYNTPESKRLSSRVSGVSRPAQPFHSRA